MSLRDPAAPRERHMDDVTRNQLDEMRAQAEEAAFDEFLDEHEVRLREEYADECAFHDEPTSEDGFYEFAREQWLEER